MANQLRPAIDRRAILRNIGQSVFINALCPFLLFRALQPHFPPDSVTPLLAAAVFPVIGLIVGFARLRRLDAIAALSMIGLIIHIVVTLLAKNIVTALILRSLDGLLIGAALVISVLVGRPLILLLVRQVVAAGHAEHARLGELLAREPRAFSRLTWVWGVTLMVMSSVHVLLAVKLSPAQYLLASPALGIGTSFVLLVWSSRFLRRRLAQPVRG